MGVSVRARDFTMSFDAATAIAEPTTKIDPKLMSKNPGPKTGVLKVQGGVAAEFFGIFRN